MDFKGSGSGGGGSVKGGDIGLKYLLYSKYFVINILVILVYPFCRIYGGMR